MRRILLPLVLGLSLIFTGCSKSNTTGTPNLYYDRAIIKLPDGQIVEGKIEEWFGGSNAVRVKIDGISYCTAYVNCVLIRTES